MYLDLSLAYVVSRFHRWLKTPIENFLSVNGLFKQKSLTHLVVCVRLRGEVTVRHCSWTPMRLSSSGLYWAMNKSALARTSNNKATTTAMMNNICTPFFVMIIITIETQKSYTPNSTVNG